MNDSCKSKPMYQASSNFIKNKFFQHKKSKFEYLINKLTSNMLFPGRYNELKLIILVLIPNISTPTGHNLEGVSSGLFLLHPSHNKLEHSDSSN